MSDDDTQDAASNAVGHFVELIRILDEAMTHATLLADNELAKRLALAKAAAEHSKELLGQICTTVTSDDESRAG